MFSVLSRRVGTFEGGTLGAGTHRLPVSTTNLPAGVYHVRLSVDGRPAGTQTLTVAR